MKVIVINNSTADAVSYLSGTISIPASSSLDVASGYWSRLYADLAFLTDLRNANLTISDGVTIYKFPDSEIYLKEVIDKFKTTPVRKDFSYSSTQTNTIIWTPTSGKKYVITDLTLNIRNSTLGAINVAIFDESNSTGNYLYRANFEAGTNYDAVSNLITEFISSNINRNLKITTSGNLMISGSVQGYETE